MSWSKNAEGGAAEILSQADGWLASVIKSDESFSASEALKDGHGRQVNAAVAAVREFVVSAPEGRKLSVIASGHANDDGTGNASVLIKEAIAPAEAAQEPSAESTAAGEVGSGG